MFKHAEIPTPKTMSAILCLTIGGQALAASAALTPTFFGC
jgi:hypothetical protein